MGGLYLLYFMEVRSTNRRGSTISISTITYTRYSVAKPTVKAPLRAHSTAPKSATNRCVCRRNSERIRDIAALRIFLGCSYSVKLS